MITATKFGAVVFDMDGVLVDTEVLKAASHSDSAAFFGKRVDPVMYKRMLGQPFNHVAGKFIKLSGSRVPVDLYRRKFNDIYRDYLTDKAELNSGVLDALRYLKKMNVPMGLVTSSQRWVAEMLLERFSLASFFGVVVTSDDVRTEKPSPEPYKKALSELGVAPENSLALEDSEAGIKSASRAGMVIYALRHKYNQLQDLSAAEREIASLSNIDLRELFGG